MRRYLCLLLIALSFVVACGGDDRPSGACGNLTCSDRQTCNVTAEVPQCICRQQFSGESCEVCAPGYEANGERCDPIEINCADDPCVGGTCERNGSGPDTCTCNEGYAGPTCAQCGAGFQDNDQNGTCLPSCSASTELLCEDYQVCRDNSGTPSCGCPVGMGGALCEDCESGYYRLGDGECMPSCAVVESCGQNGYCVDATDDGASCACVPGFGGDGCASCADGFSAVGERCIAAPDTGSLVGFANVDGYPTLARIDPVTGGVTSIFALEAPEGFAENALGVLGDPLSGWNTITRDPSRGRIWLTYSKRVGDNATDSFLVSLDPDGTPTLHNEEEYLRGRIAFVTEDNALYALYASASIFTLTKVDPETGTRTSMPITGLTEGAGTSLGSLMWEPETKKLVAYGREHQGEGGLYEIHRTTGEATLIKAMDIGDLLTDDAFSATGVGSIADGPAGTLFAITTSSYSDEAWLEFRCREMAKRAGYAEAAEATITAYRNAFRSEGPPIVIESSKTSGPEIIAATGYYGDAVEVQIATRNPDAFLCLATFEGEFTLRVMATAKFASGTFYSYRNLVKVSVDDGFEASVPAPIYTNVTVAAPDAQLSNKEDIEPSFLEHSDVFRVLTRRQWAERRFKDIESPSVNSNIRVHHVITIGSEGTATSVKRLEVPVLVASAWE